MNRNAARPMAPNAVTAATEVSNRLSAVAVLRTFAFFFFTDLAAASTGAASNSAAGAVASAVFFAESSLTAATGAGLATPTLGAAVFAGTGILIVEAAFPPSAVFAAPAEGTAILMVGAAAGLGGKLIRTVCFLVSCESPPGAGACVVSSDIVKKASNKGNED